MSIPCKGTKVKTTVDLPMMAEHSKEAAIAKGYDYPHVKAGSIGTVRSSYNHEDGEGAVLTVVWDSSRYGRPHEEDVLVCFAEVLS